MDYGQLFGEIAVKFHPYKNHQRHLFTGNSNQLELKCLRFFVYCLHSYGWQQFNRKNVSAVY